MGGQEESWAQDKTFSMGCFTQHNRAEFVQPAMVWTAWKGKRIKFYDFESTSEAKRAFCLWKVPSQIITVISRTEKQKKQKQKQKEVPFYKFLFAFCAQLVKRMTLWCFFFEAPRGRPHNEEHLAPGFWPARLRTDWLFKNHHTHTSKSVLNWTCCSPGELEPKANTQPGTD